MGLGWGGGMEGCEMVVLLRFVWAQGLLIACHGCKDVGSPLT